MPSLIRVRTGGTHREMGVDLGRAAGDVIRELVAECLRSYRRWTRHGAAAVRRHALTEFLPHVRRRYPKYLEEVRGIAEGAGVPFEDLFFLTADEELIELWSPREHCSSAVARTRRGMLVAHNEDYPPRYLGRLVVVEAHPDDAPAFLALTYPYVLGGPSCGLNAAGLAFAVDSLEFRPRRAGIPSNYVLRDLLASRRFDDAVGGLRVRNALMGNAVNLVSAREDRAATVEARPDGKLAILPMDDGGWLAHTNHVVSPSLDGARPRPGASSKRRLAALRAAAAARPPASRDALFALLSSAKKGLLRPRGGPNRSMTVATAVLDPARRTMYVVERSERGAKPRPYALHSND